MRWLGPASVAFAILAVLGPAAHVLELPNKLALDGSLWLAVQQSLYRGWGPFLGAPADIGGLLTSAALTLLHRKEPVLRYSSLVACCAFLGMIAAFFALNAPVNAAVNRWTAATLSPDWPSYRLRWEAGHAIAAVFGVIALTALIFANRRAVQSS